MPLGENRKTPGHLVKPQFDGSALMGPGETHLMYRAISATVRDPEKQVSYGHYARARYSDAGIGDGKYQALHLDEMARWRDEGSGVHKPGPLSLVPITLSQGDGTILHLHGRSASSLQRSVHRRISDWHQMQFPGKLSFCIRDTLDNALDGFKDGSLDEINLRVPNRTWTREYMVQLADHMIRKLNVDGTINPRGASVLIGINESKPQPMELGQEERPVESSESARFVDVFQERLAVNGLQAAQSGTYPVAGAGHLGRLIFVKRHVDQ
ncbi:MAG: hypothetical protein ABIH11_07435 [Candidatus Altiarchaeota archaeon]